MKKCGILTSLLLVLLVVQTPQFGQDTSTAPGKAHGHQVAISLLRTIGTAEATYHGENGSYATWQTHLSGYPKQFDEFFARHKVENARNSVENGSGGVVWRPKTIFINQFNDPPEILPGWSLRLNVHSDGQGFDLLLIDMTDEKCGCQFSRTKTV